MIKIRKKGLRDYTSTWKEMISFTDNRNIDTPDELWILEHNSVFTQGLTGKPEHLLKATKIPIIQSDRGGQITYHAPGQLIIYCLIDIKRLGIGIKKMVSIIEQSLIEFLSTYDIKGHTLTDAPGVYVKGSKIAALGLKVKQGRTYHGLSLNIDMDLSPYKLINPCGYSGLKVTQMCNLTDNILSISDIQQELSVHIINSVNKTQY
ncbi:MAG: lipoyl(octanoyl) transferase LipB [Pseudomonadota bacterium]|nr:lipoyl(octanoyl) transferase LipB [Pseudomonadota bacterium]